MKSKLGRALAGATLAAALVADAVWLAGASADQPTSLHRDYVSDTFGGAARTAVTGQCVRTTMPEAGAALSGCMAAPVETARAAVPAAPPPAAPAPEAAAAPKAVEPAAAAAPAEPVARRSHPAPRPRPQTRRCRRGGTGRGQRRLQLRQGDCGHRGSDGAEEAEPRTPVPAPEPPTEATEAPAPVAPAIPPEPSIAPPAPPAQPQPRKLRLAADTQFHFDRAQLTPSGARRARQADRAKWARRRSAPSRSSATRIASARMPTTRSCPSGAPMREAVPGRPQRRSQSDAGNRTRQERPGDHRGACKGLKGQRLIKCLAPDRRVEVEVVGLVTAGTLIARGLIHLKTRALDATCAHGGDLVSTWVAKQLSACQGPVTL